MDILFISDIHRNYDAIDKLPQADALIVGGDFVTLDGEDKLRRAIALIEKRFPTFVAVSGNMDPIATDSILAETGHALSTDTPSSICGKNVFGLGGANRSPFNTPNEWDENDAESHLSKIPADAADILVTHAPPFESGADRISSGAFVGSKAIAACVSRVHPALLLCGHIHEAAGIYKFGSTILINPGQFGDRGAFATIRFADGEAPFAWISHCN